jgi:hypothetical protein
MIKTKLLIVIIALFGLSSCRQKPIQREALLGKWKYVKVENPNSHPLDSVSASELEMESPYIKFSKNDSMMIWWGGKVLSHGTFKLDGSNIQVREILDGGKTRSFPFFVSKLTDKDLVFETSGEDGTKVTAVKQ